MSTSEITLVIFLLYALLSILSNAEFCVSGSVSNSVFNGIYAQEQDVDSNGNAYYKKCNNEYFYQYQSNENFYWQISHTVGVGAYYLRCPTLNIASPDMCPSGTWLSGPNTESSIIVDDSCSVPQISCTNILLENTESMNCDGLFTKVDNNLYSRQLSSNCGGSGGVKYWFYNGRSQRYECGDEDRRDPCQTGTYSYTRYSTDSAFGSITQGQTGVSVDVSGQSATLSCGVQQENQVISCNNIQVTGSSYCNGIFIKQADNVYKNIDTGKFWFQFTYNTFSTAYGKMMCAASDQSAVCSPTYMAGDITQNAGLPNFQSGSASVSLVAGTATFKCNVATPAPTTAPPTSLADICLSSQYSTLSGVYQLTGAMNDDKPVYKSQCNNIWLVYFAYWNRYFVNLNSGSSASYYDYCSMAGLNSVMDCTFAVGYITGISLGSAGCSDCASAQSVSLQLMPQSTVKSVSTWGRLMMLINTQNGMIISMIAFVIGCIWSIAMWVKCQNKSGCQKSRIFADDSI